MKNLTLEINSEEELKTVVSSLQEHFGKARIFLLKGNLGAGKTTFVKTFAEVLSCNDTVQSPTYGIVNEYRTKFGESIFHFDLYRIKSPTELLDIGFEDYVYSTNYCFIEWYEIAEKYLPEGCIQIHIEVVGEKRIFEVSER
jgi:tRNA threonylcarbamoyladenosine biosynthesis protein TsaE